jgi:hypothetical protein
MQSRPEVCLETALRSLQRVPRFFEARTLPQSSDIRHRRMIRRGLHVPIMEGML